MPGSDAIELKGGGGALYTYKFYLSLHIGLIRIKTCVAASDQKVLTQWLNDFFFPIVTKNFKLCSFQILILISYRLGGEKKVENYTRRNIHKKILQMWWWMYTSRKRKVRFTGDTGYTHSYYGNSMWKRLWSKRNSSSGTREKRLCVQLLHQSSKLRNNTLQDFL